MRPRSISLIAFCALALLIALIYWIPSQISGNPVVLIVGDFAKYNEEETPATRLLEAVDVMRKQRNPPYAAEFIVVSVADSWYRQRRVAASEPTFSALRDAILAELSQHDVIAIVSANTTETAPTVIDIGTEFNIPILLTVATNDRLLSDRPSAPVLRMVPKDSLQAAAIKTWCEPFSTKGTIFVIYDDAQYGRDLYHNLSQHLSGQVLGTAFRFANERVSEAVELATTTPFSAIVFIGYPDQAEEFLDWRTKLKVDVPTLLSDGCLGAWIEDHRINKENLSLCFPSLLGTSDKKVNSLISPRVTNDSLGYAPFAIQAIEDIDNCIKNSHAHGYPKEKLFSQLLEARSPDSQSEQTANSDEFRENASSQFTVYDLEN